jgi:amidohydrolase
MASCDEIYIKITGKGGHAATPHLNINPIQAMAQVLIRLEDINKKANDTNEPNVLSIGKIVAPGATNITPDSVWLSGTFRAKNEQWRNEVHDWIPIICKQIAIETKTTIELTIDKGYPCLINDEHLHKQIKQSAEEMVGIEHVKPLEPRMTSEDFAFFSQKIPICYYRLGTANADGNYSSSVHTSTFDIDKKALKTAMQTMSYAAIDWLNKN